MVRQNTYSVVLLFNSVLHVDVVEVSVFTVR